LLTRNFLLDFRKPLADTIRLRNYKKLPKELIKLSSFKIFNVVFW